MNFFECMQTQSKCVGFTKRMRGGLQSKGKDRSSVELRSDARARDGEKREHANAMRGPACDFGT